MSSSIRIYNVPRGLEQDLVRLIMNNRFSLKRYAVNNSEPFDTVIDFQDPNTGPLMRDFVNSVNKLRGQPVKLHAQLQRPAPPANGNMNARPGPQHQTPHNNRPVANRPNTNNGPPSFSNGSSNFRNGFAAHSSQPQRSSNGHSQSQSNPRRPDKLMEIRKNVRSLLATEKKGLDAMRFINNYRELTNENFFDAIQTVGFSTVTDFCNDNLDCMDYESWEHGAIAVFHGEPDAKTAHIFQMNQATRSRNAPSCKPIPARFRQKFGNFYKPPHKVKEKERKLYHQPLELPDKHKRRIIAVIDTCPQGLTTEEVKLKYSEMYEEPFPMGHLLSITKKHSLMEILALIPKLTQHNGKWSVLKEAPPQPAPAPVQPAPIVARDLSKSPEFIKLKTDVCSVLRNTTDYTMTLTSLQKFVKIDVVLFGKNSAAELLDLIDDIKIRQSVNNTWIVHLKHKGETIPNRVLNSIYSTVNSDPNGVLLEEFNVKYQRMMGRTLIAADYGYKSLWHIFYNHSDMVSMCHTKDGLLLIAEKAPEPPSHPPGIPEPMTSRAFMTSAARPVMTSAAQARPVMTSSATSSSQNHVTQQDTTSLKAEAAAARPDHVGEEEIALGYRDFMYDDEDGNLVILFINSIYSPNEFYVWFAKNGPKDIMEDYKDLIRRLNVFYSNRVNRGKHYIGKPFKRHRLCVFCDDKNNYHRCVVDVEPALSSDIVAVRDVDTGMKCEVAASSLYRIGNEFKRDKCFARRCFLSDVRPFNGSSWEPGCQEVFGQRQAEKMYFAKIMSITDQEVELDVIDTHGDEDRHFSEVLVYGGYGEHISKTIGIINNAPAPSTPNDSFHAEEEDEEEDDDWLNEWLEEEDPPLVDNTHVSFASLQLSDPQPSASHPPTTAHTLTSHPPALTPVNSAPPLITNLWDAPLTDNGASNSSSEFLKNLMQINRQR